MVTLGNEKESVKKMQYPLVSVNMITFNHEPYIKKAIEGVLMQKVNFSFELIIGEDFSTDGTREIVLKYMEKYPDIIKVIYSHENVGMKNNSIRTLQACRGKYIAFCEGDDYWHNDMKLQNQVDYLDSHPKCGLVCTDYDLSEYDGKKITKNVRRSHGVSISRPNIHDILLGRAEILTLTVLARKELVLRVVNSDSYLHKSNNFLMGDTQLWAELSLISEIYCLEGSFAVHNILEESATQSKNKLKKLRFWMSNEEMVIYLCEKHVLPRSLRLIHERLWTRYALRIAFYEENLEFANEAIQKFGAQTYKDKVWYWGTKYKSFRLLVFFIEHANNIRKCYCLESKVKDA